MQPLKTLALVAALTLSTPAVAGSVPAGATVWDVSLDLRLCPSPFCGGFQLNEVNLTDSACPDGGVSPTCYVVDIDVSQLGLSPANERRLMASIRAQKTLLTGHFERYPFGGTQALYTLVVDKFWFAPL